MGGEHSGVTEATTDILIECAYFDPEHIALTGQKLGLASDARSRFERGVDPAFLETGLAARHRDGDRRWPAASRRRSSAPERRRPPDKIVDYRSGALRAARPASRCPTTGSRTSSQRLGFTVTRGDDLAGRGAARGAATSTARPTSSRRSSGSTGYDKVPSTPLPRAPGVARPTATPEQLVERSARRAAAARGLNEAVTWSFISEAEAAPFGGARLAARQSDQRGDEGDAALAAPRPARRGGAQRRARRREHPPVRDRPALSGGGRAADPRRWSSPARAAPRHWRRQDRRLRRL